jgi:Cna protein B-type domain.
MRRTNGKGYKVLASFIIIILLLGYLPASAYAGYATVVDHTSLYTPASWPTSFDVYKDANGNIISDQNGEINPNYADITSGATISGSNPAHGSQPSVFVKTDGTNMFFRMRIGAKPFNNNGKFFNTNYLIAMGTLTVTSNHWDSALSVGFNANANGSYVYITKDGSQITKVYNVTSASSAAKQGSEAVPVSDGTGQYFLDFQVPISELKEFTDTNGNQFQGTTPIKLFFATSQANNLAVINKDMMVGALDNSTGETITPEPPAGTLSSNLNILEVQPATTYDLTTSFLSGAFPNSTINLTQMSMAEFISKVEEINGRYDIVYIGNNTSGGSYTALGTAPTNLPQGGLNNGTGTSKEYYSDNDITNRRANKLKDFINSKQLTIFDQSIFGSCLTNTKLYSNFISYKGNSTYPNFTPVNTSSGKTANLQAAFSVYNTGSSIAKRPQLTINNPTTDMPKIYDGSDASYQADKSLSFKFNINNNNNSTANNMTIKLYIDANGDGIYKETDDYAGKAENVYEKDNLNSDNGYTVNYHLSDSFIGLQPWKLELTDTSTGAKSYITGATAFKGNSGDEIRIRLLQLEPSGNTFSVYSLHNVQGQDLLYKDQVYRIDVTEMNIDDFNAAYANSTPTPAAAKVNGVATTAPTVLNGNYDMLIMGFADIYGNGDLKNANAINALKNFMATNQSIMLTHDTLTFQVNSPNTWGYNITQNLRSIVGQQRYYRTAPDSNRYYDPMPSASKDSYGFTNLTLGRYNNGVYNNGNTFETTTKTHKINDNFVTEFPFPLGDIPVSATHFQYFQLDLEDENVIPVYTLTNSGSSSIYNHPGDGRNDYYTYTKGSITFSGTGHSTVSGDSTIDEEKMFINTIMKASKGANHAPTLDVEGISDGMNIANTSSSIDFRFTATDIDPNDQYLNADIYLATSNDGTTFSAYQNVQHFSASDSDEAKRIKSGVVQAVSIPTVGSSIKAYKVKVVAYDNSNATANKEFKLNNVQDPQITIQNYDASCLVGDTIHIPVTVSAKATSLIETFNNIKLVGTLTKPDNTTAAAYSTNYPDLVFNPTSSWLNNIQEQSFPLTLDTAGNYTLHNQLTYDAYDGVLPDLTGKTSRESDQTFNINVGSGTLDVEVLDAKDRGIPGVTVNVTGSRTGTTAVSGLTSFTGLSSGDYTVTLTPPAGFTIVGSPSQTVSLSASTPYQPVKFKLSGNLITNPSITAQGSATASMFTDGALQANIGVTLNRPASFIKLDLANTLTDGSSMSVVINKVYCNGIEIPFDIDPSNPEKIIPKQPNSTFLSGIYTMDASISIEGGTLQSGQSFQISLTQQTSAQDANSGYEDTLDLLAPPLTVNVMNEKLILNPIITTLTGANEVSILKDVPLQTIVGFDLTRPAAYLKIDISNSIEGHNSKVELSNLYCDNSSGHQPISFTIDSNDPEKLIPTDSTTGFPSGTYTLNANITINGLTDNVSFVITLTDLTSAQDKVHLDFIDHIDAVSLAGVKVNVGTAPPLH